MKVQDSITRIGHGSVTEGGNVVLLDDDIGHWPQVEAPAETLEAFYDFHTEIGTFSLNQQANNIDSSN